MVRYIYCDNNELIRFILLKMAIVAFTPLVTNTKPKFLYYRFIVNTVN